MTTKIQNITETPFNTTHRQSQIPFDSIIRQVASPSAYQQHHTTQYLHPNQLQPMASQLQPMASFSSPPPHMLETAQFVTGSTQGQIHQTVPQQAPTNLPPLPPIRRIEYVPYEQRYIEYVEQRIKVPVQKVCTDYYQIEHIIDYMPIEKEETVYQMQPKEVVTMRLQYVPVEQKIIHISDKNAQALGIKEYISTEVKGSEKELIEKSPLYQVITVNNARIEPGISNNLSSSAIRKSRTNFVTSEGYDPQANLQQIDNLLSASSVRGSRVRTEK